jgi:hypothetical protein
MLRYLLLKEKPSLLRSFTGLSQAAFAKLIGPFQAAYDRTVAEEEARRPTPRQRQPGGGCKGALPLVEDKLLFILFYFKLYPIQVVQGFFFGLSQPQANYWIHRLTPVLNAALGYEAQLPARKASDVAQVLERCPALEFVIDGVERPIQRPKGKDRQRTYYSGKKKRHTVKNVVVTEKRTRKIKALSGTYEGKAHDKRVADEAGYRFPPESKLWKDTGFQGYEPEDTTTFQPKKKPKGGHLTSEEKAQNQEIARARIGVEHSLGGTKVYRIVRDIYRNHKKKFEDLIMETACGLHNLRLDFRFTT